MPTGRCPPNIVADFLGLVEADALFELGDLVARGDSAGLLRLVGRVEDRGKDLAQFARGAIEHFRRIFMIQNTDAEPEFLDLSDEEYDGLKQQADALDQREVPGYLRILQETVVEMKSSGSPRMMLEMGLVRMARPDLEISPEALAIRLEKLEERLDNLSLEPLPAPPEPAEAGRKKAPRPAAEEPPAPPPRGGEKPPPSPERPRPSTGGARRAPAGGPPEEAGVIDIATVKRAWPKVKERVKEKNRPLHAQLMDGTPRGGAGRPPVPPLPRGFGGFLRQVQRGGAPPGGGGEPARGPAGGPGAPPHPGRGSRGSGSGQGGEGGTRLRAARRAPERRPGLPPPRPRPESPGRVARARPQRSRKRSGSPNRSRPRSPNRNPRARRRPKKKPTAARPPGEVHEKHAVRMVKDVFDGAEIVEEVHLQTAGGRAPARVNGRKGA